MILAAAPRRLKEGVLSATGAEEPCRVGSMNGSQRGCDEEGVEQIVGLFCVCLFRPLTALRSGRAGLLLGP
jgi:hypothetical protein